MRSTRSRRLINGPKDLKLKFNDPRILRRALRHSSCPQCRKTHKSNETLEFLGDAVLELLVREHLYKKLPHCNEGQLSEMKKSYTSEDALHIIGKKLGIGKLLIMDPGEEATGGRTKRSNITGVLEALIGAIYLDQGLENARRFVRTRILCRKMTGVKDFKSLLNNWAMRHRKTISYKVIDEEGPAHRRIFHIALVINRRKKAVGLGKSKKKAEQMAAGKYFRTIPPKARRK
ncbi:MAG TPA: ribonuclease III [bacterium]